MAAARWLLLSLVAAAGGQNCRDGTQAHSRPCEALCRDGVCELRAALVLSSDTRHIISLPRVRPVFEVAEQSMRERGLFPEWLKFTLEYYDDRCDAAFALISAIDAYTDQCTHVYFGPACEFALASVARITRFLGHTGTPLVTVGGLTFDFVNPKTECTHEYFMLSRAGLVSFKDITYFIIAVMRSFKWTKLFLINEPEAQVEIAGKSTCYLMSKTFVNYLKQEKIVYTSWDTTSNASRTFTSNLKFYLGFKYTSKWFGWGRCSLLYETESYTEVTGQSGGFLLASTIHDFMLMEDVMVVGREIFSAQEDVFRDILLQFVGNLFSSCGITPAPAGRNPSEAYAEPPPIYT